MKDINLTLPTSWNELSVTQLKNVTEQLDLYQKLIKEFPEQLENLSVQLHLQLAKELLRGNKYKNVSIALNEIPPKEFIPWTTFIYKISRTKFISTVTINKQTFYAPDIRFRNATINEFSYVDAVWYRWRTSQKEIWLNVLCAALYREHKYNKVQRFINKLIKKPTPIDVRVKFLKLANDARADKFNNLDYKTKLAIAYTYEGCRNNIANSFPNVFPKPVVIEGEPLKKLANQKYQSFRKIILEKIKGDPSKLDKTNNILVFDFLSIVEQDIINFNTEQKK